METALDVALKEYQKQSMFLEEFSEQKQSLYVAKAAILVLVMMQL